jgi:hypothetical protein
VIREHFDFIDVVQQIVVFLHLAREKITANEEDVGETLHLMNVANCFLFLHGSFVTLDVCKLFVCQVEADDEHDFIDMSLVLL